MQSQEYPPKAKVEQTRAKTTAHNLCWQQEAEAAEKLKERGLERSRGPWWWLQRKVPQAGSQPCPLLTMVPLYKKEPSEMLSACTIWMDCTSLTITVCLWSNAHSRACTKLQLRRIPMNSAQWYQGHTSRTDEWSLLWNRTLFTNSHRGATDTQISKQGR